jgi:hypothetical protein
MDKTASRIGETERVFGKGVGLDTVVDVKKKKKKKG